jgi:hypothetical protein
MTVVARLARLRLAHRWPAVVATGIVLGLVFGVCLASATAGRRTASAYGRILDRTGAHDATISHDLPTDEAEEVFGALDGVEDVGHYTGYLASLEGVDDRFLGAVLAPAEGQRSIERPVLDAGRLPDPAQPDEVVVNGYMAEGGDLEVGDRLEMTLRGFTGEAAGTAPIEVVGIGTFPRELVGDETTPYGIMTLTPAFADEHRNAVAYRAASLFLASGVDAQRDVGPQVSALGYEVQEAREHEHAAVQQALRPLLTLVAAVGVLAFVAGCIGAAQLLQREQERWRHDDRTLRAMGLRRRQTVLVSALVTGVLAVTATVVAVVVCVLGSALAPLGPLHEFDPEQGVVLDGLVLAVGATLVFGALVLLAAAFARREPKPRRPASQRGTLAPARPEAKAGLVLSLSPTGRRGGVLRAVGAATLAVALAGAVAVVATSATELSRTPSRYGFDWDLMALNRFGDLDPEGLDRLFVQAEDITEVTSFTFRPFLLEGSTVPGLAADQLKGSLTPTILRGRGVAGDDEIVLGQETAERLGVDLDDEVELQVPGAIGDTSAPSRAMTVVGIATFPPVDQEGFDQPRLGTGALIDVDTYADLAPVIGQPEWIAVRLADGTTPEEVIARNPDGVPDRGPGTTHWFTDAKPAELRQIDAVGGVVGAAVAVSAAIALAVVVQGLWSQTRVDRRSFAVLAALGFTRRQLAEAAAWQALPVGLAVLLVGLPLGVVIGRTTFRLFASALGVVDVASTSGGLVAALVAGTVGAVLIGALVAAVVARRTHPATNLRDA